MNAPQDTVGATAHEKIHALAEQLLSQRAGDMLTRSLMALTPQLLRRLPEDHALLDRQLEEFARLLLQLRSDDAPLLVIVLGEQPTPAQVMA